MNQLNPAQSRQYLYLPTVLKQLIKLLMCAKFSWIDAEMAHVWCANRCERGCEMHTTLCVMAYGPHISHEKWSSGPTPVLTAFPTANRPKDVWKCPKPWTFSHYFWHIFSPKSEKLLTFYEVYRLFKINLIQLNPAQSRQWADLPTLKMLMKWPH